MDQFTSQKFRFYSFLSMVLLVFVHGYNLNMRYLQPFTVVSEHLTANTFIQYFLANGIFRFRIPMLFIISGYLYASRDDKPYGQRVLRRVRTLLVPYLLWSAIGLLLTFVFEHWSVTRWAVVEANLGPFAEKRIAQYAWNEYLLRLIVVPLPFQLWFIRCLLVYNLMYPWLKEAALRFPVVTFSVAGFLWLISFFGWLIEGEGLLFFTLGIWLNKTSFDIAKPPAWLKIAPLAAAWVGIAGVKTWLAFQTQMNISILAPVLLVLYKFVVLSGMLTMWFGADPLVRFFMGKQWFVWLSAFSFIIYAFHVPLVNYALPIAFTAFNAVPYYRLLLFFLLPLWVIGVCVLLGVLLRAAVPKVYGLLTGGRGLV